MLNFLLNIDQQYVFESLFNEKIDFVSKYRNPLRKDKSKGCFFKWKNDRLYFYDFAVGSQWDCISFVKEYYQLPTMRDAAEFIENDLYHEITEIKEKEKEKTKTQFIVKKKDYTENDLSYWAKYKITKDDLIKFKIFSVEYFFINGNLQIQDELTFVYEGFNDGECKIYMPISKTFKTNVEYFIERPETIDYQNKTIYITKSRKDRIILSKAFNNSFNTQYENVFAIDSEFDKEFSDFKKIVIFDNDKAGQACFDLTTKNNLLERGYIPVFIPKFLYYSRGIKDLADYSAEFSLEKTIKYINKMCNDYR